MQITKPLSKSVPLPFSAGSRTIAVITIVVAALCIFTSGLHAVDLETKVVGVDWRVYFEPAARAFLQGQNPYTVEGFYNPFWGLIPLSLIALFPINLSTALMFTLGLMAYVYTCFRMGVHAYLIVPFLVFSGAIMDALFGNLDGLLSLGFLLPNWLGVLVLAIKPQIGASVIAFWVASIVMDNATIKDKLGRSARLLAPIVILTVVSIFLYGPWFIQTGEATGQIWNTAPFPLALPAGLFLIWQGVQRKDIRWAIAAIPFVTPYLTAHTWALSTMAILGLICKKDLYANSTW